MSSFKYYYINIEREVVRLRPFYVVYSWGGTEFGEKKNAYVILEHYLFLSMLLLSLTYLYCSAEYEIISLIFPSGTLLSAQMTK